VPGMVGISWGSGNFLLVPAIFASPFLVVGKN